MNKFFLLFLLLLISCNNDDDVDCSLIDCYIVGLLVELVDADGNNLIENGTYSRNDIKVYKDGDLIAKVYETSEFNNLINIPLFLGGGNVDFEIILNTEETDLLTLDLFPKIVRECCTSDYKATRATYNGEPQVIMDGDDFGGQKIVVIK